MPRVQPAGYDRSGIGETEATGPGVGGRGAVVGMGSSCQSLTPISLSLSPSLSLSLGHPVLVSGIRKISSHALLLRPGNPGGLHSWPPAHVFGGKLKQARTPRRRPARPKDKPYRHIHTGGKKERKKGEKKKKQGKKKKATHKNKPTQPRRQKVKMATLRTLGKPRPDGLDQRARPCHPWEPARRGLPKLFISSRCCCSGRDGRSRLCPGPGERSLVPAPGQQGGTPSEATSPLDISWAPATVCQVGRQAPRGQGRGGPQQRALEALEATMEAEVGREVTRAEEGCGETPGVARGPGHVANTLRSVL